MKLLNKLMEHSKVLRYVLLSKCLQRSEACVRGRFANLFYTNGVINKANDMESVIWTMDKYQWASD